MVKDWMFPPKIRNQIKKPSLITSIQHGTWYFSQLCRQEEIEEKYTFIDDNRIFYVVGLIDYLEKGYKN